jgi:hypothetical protein
MLSPSFVVGVGSTPAKRPARAHLLLGQAHIDCVPYLLRERPIAEAGKIAQGVELLRRNGEPNS